MREELPCRLNFTGFDLSSVGKFFQLLEHFVKFKTILRFFSSFGSFFLFFLNLGFVASVLVLVLAVFFSVLVSSFCTFVGFSCLVFILSQEFKLFITKFAAYFLYKYLFIKYSKAHFIIEIVGNLNMKK